MRGSLGAGVAPNWRAISLTRLQHAILFFLLSSYTVLLLCSKNFGGLRFVTRLAVFRFYLLITGVFHVFIHFYNFSKSIFKYYTRVNFKDKSRYFKFTYITERNPSIRLNAQRKYTVHRRADEAHSLHMRANSAAADEIIFVQGISVKKEAALASDCFLYQ